MKWLLYFFTMFPLLVSGQQNYTLSGKITDAETGEDLIGVTVVVEELIKGAASNSYGFYSISIPGGNYTVRFSYVGYESVDRQIVFDRNMQVNIELVPVVMKLDEVIVRAERDDKNISSPESGVERLSLKFIENIPVLFGEKDILKTIQLLPGISNPAEGSTGFNVRGGSIGHNLILLDEAPVYSSSHLAGFFSVFNSDAIKDVTVYKGAIPANFGGRAASVVDITMNNGNSKGLSITGGIGVISSRLTIEAPIIRDRMSFIISGRRTYGDLVARLVFPESLVNDDMNFYFYDFNAKLNFTVNSRNRLFLSGYFGDDLFELGRDIGTGWGNRTGTLRWNHLFSDRLFSNTSLIYSKYDYGFVFGQNSEKLLSGIEDFTFKEEATWYINPSNTFKFGLQVTYHTFNPGEVTTGDSGYYKEIIKEKQGYEPAVYLQNDQQITSRLSANYGIRFSSFWQSGPAWFYEYNDANEPVDSSYFDRGNPAFPYFGIEPRVAINYRIGEKSSLKVSYNRMAQYLHLLSNSTAGSPTDIWMPASNNLKPLLVDHVSAGYFRNFLDNNIETSIEFYYKKMTNTVDYEDGADIFFNEHAESQVLSGNGRSYGLELYIKKKYGTFTGWISYTLSKTENRIEGINDFTWYPVKHDKTHDISVVSIFKIGQRLTLSGVWTYSTGNAVTFPGGRYVIDGNQVPYYSSRNGYRMPAYHRLDASITLAGKNRKRFKSAWDLSVYNLYNRYNAYIISFRESETVPGATEAVRTSLFGIVPSLSFNFKF